MTLKDEQKFLENGERYIATSSDVKKAVRDLVRAAAEAVGSNMGALYLIDESHRVLKPFAVVNLPEDYVQGCGEIPLGQQCCGRAALHNLPWYVTDMWSDPLFPVETREAAKRVGIRAGFSVPVVNAQGKCIGSLSAHFSDPHIPGDHEIRSHFMFAQLVALALARETDLVGRPASAEALGPQAENNPPRTTGTL